MQKFEESILEKAKAISPQLISIRRRIHQYPELSFQEYETARFVSEKLKLIEGMEVKTGMNHTGLSTGVVGTIGSGDGPTIAIRADMDALPIQELNDHSYKSSNDGIMHACGHDAHTTIGLGCAYVLSEMFENGELSGKVKFIFQPAEEQADPQGFTGSPYMIRAGVLDDVDAAIALHMDPEKRVGEVKIHKGYSMANVDTFKAMIAGTGGHAAYPHQGTDPIRMLGLLINAIQGITSRKVSPLQPAVISITHIQTNPSFNVIPNEIYLQGTIRSYDEEVRYQLAEELRDAFQLIKTLGGDFDLSIHHGEPALNNDERVIEWIEAYVKEHLPSFKVYNEPYGLGGEDFGYMTREIPGAMIFLGAGLGSDQDRGLHKARFDIDENALVYGTAILSGTVAKVLGVNDEEKGVHPYR